MTLATKTVVQLDTNNHYYLGTTEVDEDPMAPGEFLMPPNTLDIEAPVQVEGKRCYYDGQVFVYEDIPGPDLEQVRSIALLTVDSDVDQIYARVSGFRLVEYQLAEAEAIAFLAAPEGPVPTTVADWADIAGLAPLAAAQNIKSQADQWRYLSGTMRPARLRAKAEVRAALDLAVIDASMTAWQALVAGWKQALGVS